MIHKGVLEVGVREGEARFVAKATGRELEAVPKSVAVGDELGALERWMDEGGLEPGPEVNAPRWDGAPMRIGETLDWMLMGQAQRR